MRDSEIGPAQVAMLIQGSEVYGIGSIEKLYAEHWPEMTFVCLGSGDMYDWLCQRRARVELVEGLANFRPRKSLATLMQMLGVLKQARSDAARIHHRLDGRGIRVVHTQWLPQQIIAGFMRRYGYRSVWQINNNTNRKRLGGWGVTLNHRMARWGADMLLPASNYIAANWHGCGVPMRVIHNAAAPLFAAPNKLPEDGPLRCLVAGRLVESKGHHVAVAAVTAARREGCDVTLDIYGGPLDDNPYADALRRTIAAADAESAVRFMGFCHNLRQRHQEYHLGLQCRLDPEPCSLWVCETLVDGLPVLASATGGTPELIADGETGYLYPAGSADELTGRLVELARDRRRLSAMRASAFDRGQRLFTVERFLEETTKAYADLAA
jgi:glycosyltransferase involved in cell wall biosynthesis